MGKLYFLMGKSASGKDTIYKRLLKEMPQLFPYVGFTTRPKREGEQEGREYHFTSVKELKAYEASGRLIEKRVYHTVYGDWYYYSVDTAEVNLEEKDYLYIGTLESFVKIRDYYGKNRVVPIYIQVEDGLRLERALQRERRQQNPGYAEMCRRFLTDSEDFSEEKLAEAGVGKRFENDDLGSCMEKIRSEVFSV